MNTKKCLHLQRTRDPSPFQEQMELNSVFGNFLHVLFIIYSVLFFFLKALLCFNVFNAKFR